MTGINQQLTYIGGCFKTLGETQGPLTDVDGFRILKSSNLVEINQGNGRKSGQGLTSSRLFLAFALVCLAMKG